MLNKFYEWPKDMKERNIFFREVFRLPDFWKELGKKMAFNAVAYTFDIGLKLAVWQYWFGSTWSPAEYPDMNVIKYMGCGLAMSIPTAWTAIPFTMASRAYYADKTWPIEMRRGYKSPLNALLRIPFEEGPSYLFRGGLPIAGRDATFFSFFFVTYVWLKNKLFYFWVYQDFSYEYMKCILMGFAFILATCASQPWTFARHAVDLWPKERGGHCTWDNNYRVAVRWMFDNTDIFFTNYFTNYWSYAVKRAAPVVISVWVADNLGMFSNVEDSTLGIENNFPIFLESA